MISRK